MKKIITATATSRRRMKSGESGREKAKKPKRCDYETRAEMTDE